MQTNRLFNIVYILLGRKQTTAKELAERLGVSQRTIYRDIDTLSLSGIPVYTEKGKSGGISLLPDFVLNKSLLSEREQNEILSALQGLARIKTDETNQLLKKLSTIFNKTAEAWLEVDFTDWNFQGGEVFTGFKTAILERRIVEFDYYSAQAAWASSERSERPAYGEMTRRRVEPIQLWFKSRAWYLKSFCLTRQDMRLFRLSRVRSLTVTDEVFAERNLLMVPPNPIPEGHQKLDVTLVLKIAPVMTYRVFDEFGEIERQPDGSFLVTVTCPEDEWVYGFILSFGEHIEVIEPERVREIIKSKLLKTARKYL